MTDAQTSLESPSHRPSQSGSYGKTAKMGALWKLGGQSFQQLIEIPTAVILARLLTPQDFGIAAATSFFLSLANKLEGLGFGGGALIRLKTLRSEHLSSVFVVNLVSALCIWAALTATAPSLAAFFRNDSIGPALRVGALIYFVLPFGVGQFAVLKRELRFREVALISWVFPIVFFCVAVPMAALGYGFWSLIWGQLCANTMQVLAKIWRGGQRHRFKVSRQALRETIPFGAGLSAKRLLKFSAEYLDSLIVGRVFGVTSLGLYDKAFNTASRVVDRLSFDPAAFLRIFAILHTEPERFRRAYVKVVTTVAVIVFPVFAALIVTAPQFIQVLFGDQWLAAVLPFQILCVSGPLRLLIAYASSATQATGIIWSEVWRQIVYVAMVVTAVLLCLPWGIAGAAFGVTIASLCMAVMMQLLACHATNLRGRDVLQALAPGLVGAGGLALVLMGVEAVVRANVHAPAAWVLLVSQSVPGLLFYTLFVLYGPFRTVREAAGETLRDFAPGVARYLAVRDSGSKPAEADAPL